MCRLLERLVALWLCLVISPLACAEPKGSVDLAGDPLPAQARARLGTLRLRTHDGAFPIMHLSRDGTRAVYLGNSENVLIVDARTGAERARVKLENFNAPIVAAALDETGATLAWYNSTAATIFVHDLATGKQVQSIPQATGYQTLHLSSNGATVVMLCDNGTGKPFLDAWSVKTGKKLGHFEPLQNQGVQVAVSHDGKFAATWGWYQPPNGKETEADHEVRATVQIWDTESGKSVLKLVSKHPQIAKAEISRDGKWLLATDASSGLSLFSLETGKLVRHVITRQGVGSFLAFAPDGKSFAAGTPTGFVQIFETESGKRLEASQGPLCGLMAITFPEKGKMRAFGMDCQTLRSWELSSESSADELTGHTGSTAAIQFLPDKKQIVTSGIDGRIMFWDAASFALVKQIDRFGPSFTRGNYMPPNPGAFSADGKYLVTFTEQGTNAVYDTATGKVLFDIPGMGLGNIRPALAARQPLVALPYQKQVPTGWEIWTGVWNLETGEELRQFKMPWTEMHGAAISPDGKSVACVRAAVDPNTQTWVMEVGAWNVGTGKEQFQFKININAASPTGGITYSPDGRSLLIGVVNAFLWVPDAATGAGHRLIPVANDNTLGQPMVFAPDGRTFATVRQQFPPQGGVESKIQIWETASHSLRMELPGHFATITALTFSPDGKTLGSTAHDTTAILWDVTRLKGDKAPGDKLEPKELNALWDLLNDQNAEEAFRAILRLAAAPNDALPLLKEHVQPADDSGRPTKDQIIKWIKQLDDDDFQVREKAGDALIEAGKLAQPELTKALEGSLSIEARTRVQTILEKIGTDEGAKANLRPLRAVEVLERIGTSEARDFIKKLAAGKPEAPLTESAKAALERMK